MVDWLCLKAHNVLEIHYMLKRIILPSLTLILLLVATVVPAVAQDDAAPSGTPTEICESVVPADEPSTREYDAPETVLDPTVDYYAVFCTGYGAVYVDLFEELAPETVNNFVFLAQNNFYNNLTFHRVIDQFMVQGGDPAGNGSGGPGYQFNDEFVRFVTFDRPGLLAMANSGPATNGSQFFITTVVTDWLNYNHTIFGEVVDGQANVTAIPPTEVEPDVALEAIVIIEDPAQVTVDYVAPDGVAAEDLLTRVGEFPDLASLVVDEDRTGEYDAEGFVALLPEDVQETVSTLFADNNHDFSVTISHSNSSCDFSTIPLDSISFEIHGFASAADARTVFTSDDVNALVTKGNEGTPVTMDFSGVSGSQWNSGETVCEGDATQARVIRQVGRFVIVTEAVIPAAEDVDAQILDGLNTEVYDLVFFDDLRLEASVK